MGGVITVSWALLNQSAIQNLLHPQTSQTSLFRVVPQLTAPPLVTLRCVKLKTESEWAEGFFSGLFFKKLLSLHLVFQGMETSLTNPFAHISAFLGTLVQLVYRIFLLKN